MSDTAVKSVTGIAISTILAQAIGLTTLDINATPDDVFTASQGDARSMSSLVGEIAGFNNCVAAALTGDNSVDMGAAMQEASGNCTDKSSAIATLQASADAVQQAIDSVEDSDWLTELTAPWGMPTTKANLALWAAAHTCYHDGQINYIQVLNGDNEVHWMPPQES